MEENLKDMEYIPNNQGYHSSNIQLTQPDTHLALYTIDVTYVVNSTTVIESATPRIVFPIYIDKDYNLDDIIQENFDEGILDYAQRVYYITEETDEDDEVIKLLGMLYCTPKSYTPDSIVYGDVSSPGCEPKPLYYFDCAEWDYRVIATKAFNKDFVYPISENRKNKEITEYDS